MKVTSRIVPRVMLIVLLASGCDPHEKCCDCLKSQGEYDDYDYPLEPGMPEWASLQTGAEMYAACQIPPTTLKEMCTHGLIQSWMLYPLRTNVFVWTTPQRGIEEMQDNFNGLNELLVARLDAGTQMLSRYAEINPDGYGSTWSSVEKGRYAITFTVFELTIAQRSILEKMSAPERRSLVAEALKKRTAKESDPLYSPLFNPSDVYIMARAMVYDNFDKFIEVVNQDIETKHFAETAMYISPAGSPDPDEDLRRIVELAELYILR